MPLGEKVEAEQKRIACFGMIELSQAPPELREHFLTVSVTISMTVFSKLVGGAFLGLLLTAGPGVAGTDDASADVSEKNIQALISLLDDDDYQTRVDATERLCKAGEAMFPVLDQVDIDKQSPEAAWRLRSVIDSTGWVPPYVRKEFDDAARLLKSREILDRRKGLAAILNLGKKAEAGLRKILSLGEGTCEVRTSVDRHTYEGGGTVDASVTLHNTGTTSFWICLPGTDTPYVGKAGKQYNVELLKRIEPCFKGFWGGGIENLGRCGGCLRLFDHIETVCICDNVENLLDHFVLLSPGESLDLGRQEIPLPTTERILRGNIRTFSPETPVVATIAHGYYAQENKPSDGWTFCSHTNRHSLVLSNVYRMFRFHAGYIGETQPVNFYLLPKVDKTKSFGSSGLLQCALSLDKTSLTKGEDIPLRVTLTAGDSLRVWDPRAQKFPLTVIVRNNAGEVVDAGVLANGILGGLVVTFDDIETSTIGILDKGSVSASLPVRLDLLDGNYTIFAVLTSIGLRTENEIAHWWRGNIVTNSVAFTIATPPQAEAGSLRGR